MTGTAVAAFAPNSPVNTISNRRGFFAALIAVAVVAAVPHESQAKGRTGSRRVGGSGRSGKGGRYVGGRK